MVYFEDVIPNIYFSETKKYFLSDVLPNYINQSHRSCIISLWNVLLYDLEKKVHFLHDSIDDAKMQLKYKKLIDKFGEIRTGKKLGEEIGLIEEIATQTNIISSYECSGCIKNLKNERNLCAHPIIEKDLIYCTNSSMTRGFCEEVLKILVRKPVVVKIFFNNIIEEIASTFSSYNYKKINELSIADYNRSEFNYIKNKYYIHLQNNEISKLFDILFKFTFIKSDSNCDINRQATFIALTHFVKLNESHIKNYITNNIINFVENITSINENIDNQKAMNLFIYFVLIYADIFKELNQIDQFRNYISIKKDTITDFILIYEFILESNDFKKRLTSQSFDNILNWIIKNDSGILVSFHFYLLECIEKYYERLGINEITAAINNICIRLFVNSSDFNMADFRFDEYILPRLQSKKFKIDDIIKLVTESESNGQIHYRGKARLDHRYVAEYLTDSLDINLSDIPIRKSNFFMGVTLT